MTKQELDMQSLLRLQITVLTLGEAKRLGWWNCEFLSPVGLSFLQRLYPRNYFFAAVQSSSRAARAVHDTAIGVGNAFHLFRLPREIENAARTLAETKRDGLAGEFSPILEDRAALLEMVKAMSGHTSPRPQAGPLRVGNIAELRRSDWLLRLAGAYYIAFRDGIKVFPYFSDTRH